MIQSIIYRISLFFVGDAITCTEEEIALADAHAIVAESLIEEHGFLCDIKAECFLKAKKRYINVFWFIPIRFHWVDGWKIWELRAHILDLIELAIENDVELAPDPKAVEIAQLILEDNNDN